MVTRQLEQQTRENQLSSRDRLGENQTLLFLRSNENERRMKKGDCNQGYHHPGIRMTLSGNPRIRMVNKQEPATQERLKNRFFQNKTGRVWQR